MSKGRIMRDNSATVSCPFPDGVPLVSILSLRMQSFCGISSRGSESDEHYFAIFK